MEPSKNDKPKKFGASLNTYARYSSLAFQMMAILLAFVYGGVLLDRWTGWSFPVFKLVLSLLGVGLSIYYAIKDFLKKP
jgi:F0F1-type ATP synthase assembly protein I